MSVQEFAAVFYGAVDGIPNYSDSFIMNLYERTVADQTANMVFMGSEIHDAQSFLNAMKAPGVLFYVLYVKGEVAGIAWLNRMQYRWAQFHFTTFKEFWGRRRGNLTVELGKYVLRDLLTTQVGDNYLFDMFVGVMPSRNRIGLAYVQKCGGVVSGTLPYGVFNSVTGESEEATIITLTREGLK